MKAVLLLSILTILAAHVRLARAEATELEKARLRDIGQRALNSNQPQALLEATTLPPDVALPFLSQYMWTYRNTQGEYLDTVRKAVISIPNYEGYFAEKLAAASRLGRVDNETYELLSLLATPQAEAVVTPYLFDFAMTPGDGHIRSEVNALSAAWALGEMRLSDAPTRVKPGFYQSADILAWQNWAIAKGLVPRSTKAEVPQWLVAVEAPAPAETKATSSPRVLQIPSQSKAAVKPEPLPIPTAERPSSSSFPIIPVVILSALSAGAALFYLRRNSV